MGMKLVARSRDLCLEAIKRPALRALHASARGEAAILRVYLMGEEHAEQAVLLDALAARGEEMPRWLARWLERPRADEARHADMLRARLRELRGSAARTTGEVDPVSRWKLRRLRRLAEEHAEKFEHGIVVPLLAIAWRMEQMAVRVFERHLDVLDATDPSHPTATLLRKLCGDEKGHVAAMRRALTRLTQAPEWNDLQLLVVKIDRIERAFGVTGAALLLSMGVLYWMLPAPAANETRAPHEATAREAS